MDDVIKSLEDESPNLFKWFLGNRVETNSIKCQLITNMESCMNLNIGNINTENVTCENVLVVKVRL